MSRNFGSGNRFRDRSYNCYPTIAVGVRQNVGGGHSHVVLRTRLGDAERDDLLPLRSVVCATVGYPVW